MDRKIQIGWGDRKWKDQKIQNDNQMTVQVTHPVKRPRKLDVWKNMKLLRTQKSCAMGITHNKLKYGQTQFGWRKKVPKKTRHWLKLSIDTQITKHNINQVFVLSELTLREWLWKLLQVFMRRKAKLYVAQLWTYFKQNIPLL